jgi:pimeloyl-ACP methyl ester carboxylesterase
VLQRIPYKDSTVAFHSYGTGAPVMIALHGYGETGSSFSVLAPFLNSSFSMICPDLPFHGETEWKENNFDTNALYEMLNTVVPLSLRKITLVGYSMGGRIALAFAQQYPELVEKLVLIAPDGLHKNFWYWLATQTSSGNKLFASTMKNPGWIVSLMNTARKFRLLNKSIFKFVHYYLDDETARKQLYERWTSFKTFNPSLKKLRGEKKYKTVLIYGKYDRIISFAKGKQLSKKNECISIKLLQTGHQVLAEKHAKAIAALCMRES